MSKNAKLMLVIIIKYIGLIRSLELFKGTRPSQSKHFLR